MGLVDPAAVAAAIRPDTALISVMYANNEIGTIEPIAEIGAVARQHGIPFHTDAVQVGGQLPLDVQALNVDLLALSAHKFYGPKGVGLLYVRRGTKLLPTQTGGSQERGRRAGTENVPYIVGMAAALELAQAEREAEGARLKVLRDRLVSSLLARIPDAELTGDPTQRLPGHASLVIRGVEAQSILIALDLIGVAASSGSACASGAPTPSHVLTAIGVDPTEALGALRSDFGPGEYRGGRGFCGREAAGDRRAIAGWKLETRSWKLEPRRWIAVSSFHAAERQSSFYSKVGQGIGGMPERVVVAMSGGVDSSVAAALLVEQGYEVIGVMLRLWSEPLPPTLGGSLAAVTNRCCSVESVHDARSVADKLGIPFYVLNAEETFEREVVRPFIATYAAGRTPNPCLSCNRKIRFGYLLNYATRTLGARYLATGHYARIRRGEDGRYQLWRGADRGKDQSYVLSVLGQADLAQALLPVGEYTKPQVRGLAAERGLPTASRVESQDLCFVADGNYRRFLADHAPEAMRPGPILDTNGRQLGVHAGLPAYTIGQRGGLGIAAAQPLYVLALDITNNALIVGTGGELGRSWLARGAGQLD